MNATFASKFFGPASKLAWGAAAATISGFIILPLIGGIIGIVLGFMARKDPNNHNRILPMFAILGGFFNVLAPIFLAISIGICNLCLLSAYVGMGGN